MAKHGAMPDKVDGNGTSAASLSRVVSERVAPLARAFAQTPLMELRVRTSEGSIRLVKAASESHALHARPVARAALRSGPRQHLTPTFELGQTYETIGADVVGIFTVAPDVPQPGGHLAEDQILGYIEALKLKHPVRSGGPCVLVSQIAEDDQPVDFGEPLFVVDRAEAPGASPPHIAESAPATPEMLEPPRL